MNSQLPPPLPRAGKDHDAWRFYLRAAAFLAPTVLIWSFGSTFLLPKVRLLWSAAGLNAFKAQWLMESIDALFLCASFALGSVILAVVFLEFCWDAWPRYRRVALDCIALFFHTAALTGITFVALAACLAGPMLDRQGNKDGRGPAAGVEER